MELDVKEMRGFKVGDSFKTLPGRENYVKYYDAYSEGMYNGGDFSINQRKIISFIKIHNEECIVVTHNMGHNWAIPFSELERIGMIPKESMEFNIWN